MSPGQKSKDRTYLREEERDVLSAMLDDWSSKPDKKARDAFVSAEAVLKIQDLNVQEFGPDIISKDKVARVLWEKRVQAVYTWFKNHKPFKDRKVFRMERKISLRRVVGKMRAEELQEMITTRNPDIEKGDKRYPGLYQKALTDYMAQMSSDDKKEMQNTLDEWQADGPPIDVQLRAAKKYGRRGILNAHQLLSKEMHISCITLAFVPDPDTGVMGVTWTGSHDYISSLYSQIHGKKMKTFKEWCSGGYARLIEDVIGYANYVNEQSKTDTNDTPPPDEVTLECGPGQLPLLPPAVKGVRGGEVAKRAQEIIRAYFLRHYRRTISNYCALVDSPIEMATGSDSTRTPWAVIGEDSAKFFEPECLPEGFKFQDPSRMAVSVKVLIAHLRQRQEEHGVKAFRFHHVLQNNRVELAQYPDPAKEALDDGSKNEEEPQPTAIPKKLTKKKKKTPQTPKSTTTQANKVISSDKVNLDPVLFESGNDKIEKASNDGNILLSPISIHEDKSKDRNEFVFPATKRHSVLQGPQADMQAIGCLTREEPSLPNMIIPQHPHQYPPQHFIHPGWAQHSGPIQPTAEPLPFHPAMGSNQPIGFPQYPFPYPPMGYWSQHSSNNQEATGANGLDSKPSMPNPIFGSNEYPLPPGPPPFAGGYQQFNSAFSANLPAFGPEQYVSGPTIPVVTPEITINPPTWTPVKQTPKRKRGTEDDNPANTPSRSGRIRKPTQKVRELKQQAIV